MKAEEQTLPADPGDAVPLTEAPHSTVAAWWSTIVFFLLYNLAFIDRQMLNLLVDPIRASLGISDFQVSILQGFAFAVFYCLFGLAIGWLVDHKPRRAIVAVGIVVWSIAAASCGLATRFVHMFVSRVGVAAGEATLAPAAYSILSDAFPAQKLALPMSFMGTGAALGGALAGLIASAVIGSVPVSGIELPQGWHLEGWQLAFIVTGIPGLLLTPLIFTVREPVRRSRSSGGSPATPSAAGSAIAQILNNRQLYTGHFLGFAVFSMCNYAIGAWLPTFFMRVHGLSLEQAALAFGGLIILAGVPGGIAMGWIVDRWFAAGRRDAHMRFFAIMALVQMVCLGLATHVASTALCIVLLVPVLAGQCFTGVAAAALQIVTPRQIRGQVSSIYLFVFNLIGLGFGPSVAAFFTDFVFRDPMRVGSSLFMTLLIFAPVTTALMLYGGPAMRRVVAAGEGDPTGPLLRADPRRSEHG